jgi:catechol 2,3-dioxygenase-like lactoylglutathione lyase family enzyme
MAVDVLQHVNLRTADVERSKTFYVDVIGLRLGPRPPLESIGYWLYLGEQPVVHLVQRAADALPATGGGAVDHVAFHGVDYDATSAHFRAMSIPFRAAVIPRDGTRQLFVHDPDGVKIELNFDPGQA